jgi:hypothetical protein
MTRKWRENDKKIPGNCDIVFACLAGESPLIWVTRSFDILSPQPGTCPTGQIRLAQAFYLHSTYAHNTDTHMRGVREYSMIYRVPGFPEVV